MSTMTRLACFGLDCFGEPHKCALLEAGTWLFGLLGITLICMTMVCLQYSREDIFRIGLSCNNNSFSDATALWKPGMCNSATHHRSRSGYVKSIPTGSISCMDEEL